MTEPDAGRRRPPDHLVVGHVTKPHGTRGEVFVWPLTDRPGELYAEGSVLLVGDEAGRAGDGSVELIVERSRPFKRGQLVKFEALNDRDAVESLSGRYLLRSSDSLGELGEGEVFYHDLLGCEVVTAEGTAVGTVREVYETHPAHLLEVEATSGKRHLIPFAERVVRSVDAEAGRIVIEPPPGLLDL